MRLRKRVIPAIIMSFMFVFTSFNSFAEVADESIDVATITDADSIDNEGDTPDIDMDFDLDFEVNETDVKDEEEKLKILPFDDCKESGNYYSSVLWAYAAHPQIVAGVTANEFKPFKSCTRAQVVSYLWRMKNCPEPKTKTNPFSDVNESDFFYKSVLWAYENNIVSGKTSTRFGSNDSCTRAQFVTFLWRLEGKPSGGTSANPFVDVKSESFYKEAVIWASENGITYGRDATHFAPEKVINRAQTVMFLKRLNDYFFGDVAKELLEPDEDSFTIIDEDKKIAYINNTILAFFRLGTRSEEVKKVADSIGGTVVGAIPFIDLYQIHVNPSSLDELEKLCAEIETDECVSEAFVDMAYGMTENSYPPNDPWTEEDTKEEWSSYSENHYGTDSSDNPSGNNFWQEAIDTPYVWDKYQSELGKIRIGILDTGVKEDHEDLEGKVYRTSLKYTAADHGTRIAGIIGATHNNNIGISGIVNNSEIYSYDIKIWKYTPFDRIIDGLYKLIVENDVKIVNFSQGIDHPDTYDLVPDEDTLKYNDDDAHNLSCVLGKLLENGEDFLIVQSAGNGNHDHKPIDAVYDGFFNNINEDNCYCPYIGETDEEIDDKETERKHAIIDRIIVVAAAHYQMYPNNKGGNTVNWSLTSWSNRGDRVDIAAPGAGIYSTSKKEKYDKESGTSFAAPIVAGVAGLVWSVNDEFTGIDVKKIVCGDYSFKYYVTGSDSYKLVNAKLAVEAALALKEDNASVYKMYDSYLTHGLAIDYGVYNPTQTIYAQNPDVISYSRNWTAYGHALTGFKTLYFDDVFEVYSEDAVEELKLKNANLSGIYDAIMCDYNDDGKEDMLVVRSSDKIPMGSDDILQKYKIVAELYSMVNKEIVLVDSITFGAGDYIYYSDFGEESSNPEWGDCLTIVIGDSFDETYYRLTDDVKYQKSRQTVYTFSLKNHKYKKMMTYLAEYGKPTVIITTTMKGYFPEKVSESYNEQEEGYFLSLDESEMIRRGFLTTYNDSVFKYTDPVPNPIQIYRYDGGYSGLEE
ncbi:MAG: S8 family serine peptidase [Eubacterium sp.]|nr:S8 family serine peptidase [Eubacterium sp.]